MKINEAVRIKIASLTSEYFINFLINLSAFKKKKNLRSIEILRKRKLDVYNLQRATQSLNNPSSLFDETSYKYKSPSTSKII